MEVSKRFSRMGTNAWIIRLVRQNIANGWRKLGLADQA
jgi:hypothetical protein